MKPSKTNTPNASQRTEDEVSEMQRRIDEGIFLAQRRLVERARLHHSTLVICRKGEVVEVSADEVFI